MTRLEFTSGIAFLERAVGVSLTKERLDPFFELLGDLPYEVFAVACKRVALEHRWNTFPTIAELRQAASETQRGRLAELSAAEAWQLAWEAAGRIDPEVEGSAERGLAGLPAIVAESIKAFGLNALCYGREPVGVVRGQFMKIFESLAARERRAALIPQPLALAVSSIGMLPRQPKVDAVIARIGVSAPADKGQANG